MSLAGDLTADLDKFFDPEEFAVKAVWKGSTEVNVIFDDPYLTVGAAGVEVESTAPVAHVRTADVPGIKHGDALKIGETTYKIRGVRPDGTGVTLLTLSFD